MHVGEQALPEDLQQLAALWPDLDANARAAVAAGLAPVLAVARALAQRGAPPA